MSDQTRLKANKKARLKLKCIAKANGKLMEAQLIDVIDVAYHKMWQKGDVEVSPKDFKGGQDD